MAESQSLHTIRGIVSDSTGMPLEGASIRIFSEKDTLSTISKADGSYRLEKINGNRFQLFVSLRGFKLFYKAIASDDKKVIILDTLYLSNEYQQLDSVTVRAVVPVSLKGDTLEYKAEAFKSQPGDVLEDLLKKFPGIAVDARGQITAKGKKIARVTVNGKDFFGDDVQVALKNLPYDVMKTIQVVQDYGEASKLTGIRSGQAVQVLNINTRDDKSAGHFGQVSAGAGFDGHYQVSGFANKFNKEDRVGISSGAHNIVPGENATGINRQLSFGANYVDRWCQKLSGNGSFLYGHNSNITTNYSEQRGIFFNESLLNKSNGTADNNGESQYLNYTFLYTPDPSNTLSVKTILTNSFSHSNSTNDFTIDQSDSLNQRTTIGHSRVNSSGKNYTVRVGLIFIHKFAKPGRLVSLNTNIDHTSIRQDNQNCTNTAISFNRDPAIDSPLHVKTLNNQHVSNIGVKASYIEPLSKDLRLVLSYELTAAANRSVRNTFSPDPTGVVATPVDSLSDNYHQIVSTQSGGLGIIGSNGRLEYTINLSGQSIALNGNSSFRHFDVAYSVFHIIPSILLTYRSTKSMSVTLTYELSNDLPEYRQLLPGTDYTNPQYPVVGNPALKTSLQHDLDLNFTRIGLSTGDIFVLNFGAVSILNGVVTNVTNPISGGAGTVIQETHYLNTNGVYSFNSSYNYSKSFLSRKLVASLRGGLGFNNNVSYVNSIKSINANWQWHQGAQLTLTLPGMMDLSLNADYSSSETNFGTSPPVNTKLSSLRLGLVGKINFSPNLIFSYEASQLFNKGYSNAVAANPVIINTFLERQFRKNTIALKLHCYNLLNQQVAIARTISGNIITDARANLVGRYIMLTGNIKLNKYSGANKIKKRQFEHKSN